MKIAAIGDFHIPSRAHEIPSKIKSKLKKESPDLILCTGDLITKKTLKQLEEIAETRTVQGNMDKERHPEKIDIEEKNKKITVIHGNQVIPRGNKDQLTYIAKEKESDILIHGHTHKLDVEKIKGVLLINPGSATGVWSGGLSSQGPSFIILKINQKIKIKKIYENREEEEIYEFN
ncbi:MAG: YfcE family phosphodiesterase [archaeon]